MSRDSGGFFLVTNQGTDGMPESGTFLEEKPGGSNPQDGMLYEHSMT